MSGRHESGPWTPFDHRPDPVLGAALRAALDPGEEAAFVARVLAKCASARAPTWEILSGWAHRGLVAAAAAALVAGFAAGRALRAPAPTPFEAGLASPSGAPVALLTAEGPPDPSVLFATLVER